MSGIAAQLQQALAPIYGNGNESENCQHTSADNQPTPSGNQGMLNWLVDQVASNHSSDTLPLLPYPILPLQIH